MIVLESSRLRLRRMDQADAPLLLEIFADPVAMRYYRDTKDAQETAAWIDWNLASYERYGVGLWIVEVRETGEFIGQCGITMQDVEGVSEPEIGYLFARRAWGQGFATEAANACRDHAFGHLRYPRLVCLAKTTNAPSRRVAERVGFRLERTFMRRGSETCLYTLAADDWAASRPG